MQIDLIFAIVGVILFAISEVLPFVKSVKFNGILDSIRVFLTYVYVKAQPQSDISQEVNQLKNDQKKISLAL